MPDRRHQPRPSSAQWHAGLLAGLRAAVAAHAEDPDPAARVVPVVASERGPGWFRVDRLDPALIDRLDRAQLVADADDRRYPVLDVRCDGDLVEVRVQPAAPETGLRLVVQVPRPVERYRDLLAGLDGPAAVKAVQPFARSVLDRLPAHDGDTSALTPNEQAVAATRTAGLHVVWAPPTTSAVPFIVEALSTALDAGQRCLLVSADPLGLDTTVGALVRTHRPDAGQVVRVGPARIPQMAEDARVGLAALAAADQPELSRRIDDQQARVLRLREAEARVAVRDARRRLTGFGLAQHRARSERLATAADLNRVSARLAEAEGECAVQDERLEDVEAELRVRVEAWQSARVAEAESAVRDAESGLAAERGGLTGWRRRRTAAAAVRSAEALAHRRRTALAALRDASVDPAYLIDAADIGTGSGSGPGTDELTRTVQQRQSERARAEELQGRLAELRAERDRLVARPQPEAEDAGLVRAADESGQPDLAADLPRLVEVARAADDELERAGDDLAALIEQRSATGPALEAGLLDRAGVVATTMDRLVSSRALTRRQYGLVIVDHAAAAPLPEVVFAAARAGRSCVLVGDFLQPGPMVPPEHHDDHYFDHDVFEHFGLTSARAAQHHPGCVLLAGRRSLGPVIVDYLNAIAYQGVLERPAENDPAAHCELVWIDVDGLPSSLTAIHVGTGPDDPDETAADRSWAAGARIAVAVAEQHRALGQSVGVITPYARQAEAIRAAFEQDAGAGPEPRPFVGTAAEVGSRRFDVVVFDTVEDGQGWLAAARRDAVGPDADWCRDGLRVVDAGVSRARQQVYLVASGRAMRGDRGTPMGELVQLCASGAVPRLSARRVLEPVPTPAPGPSASGPSSSRPAGPDVGVQHQGDRSVVDQADGHVGAEDAGLDVSAESAQ